MEDYDPEWTIYVLEDLKAFYEKTGKRRSADSMVKALKVVQQECHCANGPENCLQAPSAMKH